MPKIVSTTKNPYGLSVKQSLVIKDLVNNVKKGFKFDPTQSHYKFYNVRKRSTAAVMAHENLNRPNFMRALQQELAYEVSDKMSLCLSSGLDAYRTEKNGKVVPDFDARLKYVQEINKVCGIY